jgi:hypothetical protein
MIGRVSRVVCPSIGSFQDVSAMPSHRLRWIAKALAITATALLLLVGFGYAWRQYTYPYGWSHCCLKGLGIALQQYAEEHDGHFPAGGACPEASLSLLDRGRNGFYAGELCGKTKSAEAAKAILERGELLGPDTCDWHYVEGLTLSDDSRLALVWDKVGLGHNGERLSGGGHSIWRLGCGDEVIPGSEWPRFLEEQERLMAARTEATKKGLPALTAKVRLPSGEIVDHYDAPYSLEESHSYSSGGGGSHGPWTGPKLDASVLRWQKLSGDSTWTFLLSLNGWKSKPVKVQVLHGRVIPNSVIFEMQTDDAGQPQGPPASDQLR